jgi:hypothetical protein
MRVMSTSADVTVSISVPSRSKISARAIASSWLIGDAVGRRYQVPEGATRLFLGFVEGMFYKGLPGWYANNSGELQATVNVTVE